MTSGQCCIRSNSLNRIPKRILSYCDRVGSWKAAQLLVHEERSSQAAVDESFGNLVTCPDNPEILSKQRQDYRIFKIGGNKCGRA